MEKPREWFGPPPAAELLPLGVGAELDAVEEGSVARPGDLPRARLAADRA